MKFPEAVPVKFIAGLIGAEIIGDPGSMVTGINEIHRVEPGDLVFVDHPKYYDTSLHSAASFIIINQPVQPPPGKTLLVATQPFEAYLKIVDHFRPFRPLDKMISDSARIGKGSVVMPGVSIGHDVVIGENCTIHPNVTIRDHCILGNDVVVQSGTVIGGDAFYYNRSGDPQRKYRRMKSCGRVVIMDAVEIGAGCMIDRGVTHDTRIGRGTKFDNLIHVGHDTVIGDNCLVAASVTIAGGVVIEDDVTIWGSVVINKTLTIGKGAVLLGKTGVVGDLEGGKTYWGTPAQEAGAAKRELVWIKRIPEIWKRLAP
jgi:UDP-3-O-[3-hydroxymyristoyl] glucosamine N-acyltransferase